MQKISNKLTVFFIFILPLITAFTVQASTLITQQTPPHFRVDTRTNTAQQGLPKGQVEILNRFLSAQDFHSFFNFINENIDKNSQQYIDYLLSHKNSHYPPIYWLIADYFARTNRKLETHIWFYKAMIMTQQDASICTDRSARSASHQLLGHFPKIVSVLNISPQHIQEGMNRASFFIQSIRERRHPGWACAYGNSQLRQGTPLFVPQQKWSGRMLEVFNQLTRKHRQ